MWLDTTRVFGSLDDGKIGEHFRTNRDRPQS